MMQRVRSRLADPRVQGEIFFKGEDRAEIYVQSRQGIAIDCPIGIDEDLVFLPKESPRWTRAGWCVRGIVKARAERIGNADS